MSIELLPEGVKCNLSCPYCYQSEMRDAGNFSPGYDLEAMKRGLEKENYRFTLFGGEPLLMPIADLEEIWRWGLEKFGSNSVQTNGTLITEAHLDLFQKYQVSVGISMDGPDELNDSRWAGTLEKTRAATKNSQAAIEALCATGRPPSLIVTLYRGNAVGDRLPRLKGWLAQLDRQGVKHARLHLLEVENADVRARQALTEDENVTALLDLMAFQDSLTGMRFDLFTDMVNLLLGTDGHVSCIWNACDPMTTRAVRGVNGVGDNVNCGRTNKDGVDFGKADVEGFERQLVLHETPYEQGGCKDCRFFAQCKGNCPGTSIDGDWRNRSEQCQVWFRLFEKLEADLARAGKIPLSVSPLRPKLEAAMITSWRTGKNMSVAQAVQIATGQAVTANLGDRDHGDHWDAGDNFLHADGAEYLHGDHGTTEYHGDGPHGDVPHGDS